jgi:autotransporter-associated beta strand protein
MLTGQRAAQASLIAYEGFNYGAGSGNLSGLNSGFGWGSPWYTINNGSSSVAGGSLTAGGSAPAGYDALSGGNSAFTPNGTRAARWLDRSSGGGFGSKGYINGNGHIGADGKTLYISFLQQPNGTAVYFEFEFHRGDLGDPGRMAGIGNDAGDANVHFRIEDPAGGGSSFSDLGAGNTSVNFYVVRIDFLSGNNTVRVYRNPTSATEPGSPTWQQTGITADMSFDGIAFGAFNNGLTVAHDEVRLGETWADVTVSPGTFSTGLWDGGGADNKWSTGGNWDNNTVPVFASPLTFAGSTRLNNTNDLTGVAASSITFDSAAGAFTLNGNSLGLNGNISFNGDPSAPITQTINLALTPSANFTVDTRATGNIAINGGITGPGSELTQSSTGNAGVLTLGGVNTLKGLVINGGTNRITGTTAINGIGGSSFFYLADGQTTRKGTLIIENGANLSVSGAFQDAAVIGRDGGIGTVIQNGGTFSFDINDGSHEFIFVGASGNSNTRAEYDMNGGLLDMNGKTLGVALGANTVITGVVNQVAGVITNVGNLLFSPFFAQGRGAYNLNGGSLYIGSGGITAFGGSIYQMNLGGGTVGAVASWSSTLNMTLTGTGGATTFNPGGNTITLSGVLSGTGGLSVNGAGILELSGANTYSGDTLVTSGSTLQLDSTGSRPGAMRLASGSTLNLNYTGNYAVSSLYLNGVLQPAGTYNSTTSPAYITGSGNLVVSSISSGLWTGLGANNNWSTGGNWDNNVSPLFPHALTFAGNNRLNNNNDLSSISISTLTFSNTAGAFTLGGNAVTLTGSIGFSGNPAAPVTQTINFDMIFPGDQTFNLPANGNLVLNGSLTSGNSLFKSGLGTLTLGGASDGFNSFYVDGGTNIITGDVAVTGTGGSRFYVGDIGTVGAMVIQPGAVLNVSGSFADAGVIGRDSGSGTVIQNGGTFSFNMANQANLFVGASSSAATRAEYDMNGGILDMNGFNLSVGLSANNATLITGVVSHVSGSITNVGLLDLGAFHFGPGRGIYRMIGGSIYIGAGGIQSDSGVYEIYLGGGTVGASSGWASALNMSLSGVNGAVTFDTAGNTINLTGSLSGPGGLGVVGGGILELGGANTFAGDMTVTAGTLQLDVTGSSAGNLRQANGTTLNLNFGGNYVVAGYYTNGVALPPGTYNTANMPAFIAGPGNLLVQHVSTGIWLGLGANNYWSTSGNWDGNAVPNFPLGLTFGANSRLSNTNDLTGATATSITFSNTAGPFTLNGNSLNLSGNIGFNANPASPITEIINLPLVATADVNLNTPANGNVTVAGGFTAANNNLFKLGGGTMTLAGNNTFAGFEVDGGTNVITGTTTVSGTGGSRAYVGNADYVGGSVGTLVIPNGATFAINGNFADAYVVGRDGGVGYIIQNGGTFDFNPGNQTYMFMGAANNPATRSEYHMNGGLLDMHGKTLGVALGVNVLVTGVVSQVSGVITNVGQIFLDSFFSTGHSILDLSGGSIYIGSGGITVQSGGAYEIYLGGITVGASATWASSLNMQLTGNNGATAFLPSGNNITLSGSLSGPGGLIVSGTGALELAGANTYTGDTAVNSGSTLKLDTSGNSSGTFRAVSGATLNLNYIGTMTVSSFYTNGVSLPGGIYNSGNLSTFITGTGSLHVLGVPSTPTNITFSVSGSNLNLSWPANYLGWILQQRTNSLTLPAASNWVDVPGSSSITATNIPIHHDIPTVFYRLRHP